MGDISLDELQKHNTKAGKCIGLLRVYVLRVRRSKLTPKLTFACWKGSMGLEALLLVFKISKLASHMPLITAISAKTWTS